MGNSSSYDFSQTLSRLFEIEEISQKNNEYWGKVFTSDIGEKDLFSLLKKETVRDLRKRSPLNLAMLVFKCIEQLHLYQDPKVHLHRDWNSVKHSLLYLLRVLPVLLEDDEDEFVENLFFRNKVLVPGGDSLEFKEFSVLGKMPLSEERSLGVCMIEYLISCLFLRKFSIPISQVKQLSVMKMDIAYPKTLKLPYLWDGGLVIPKGNCWASSEQLEHRHLVLRCLLASFTKDAYTYSSDIYTTRNKFLAAAQSETAKMTANLFYSLLNEICSYDPSTYLPYTSQLMVDPKEKMVLSSLHLLLILIHRHVPQENVFYTYLVTLSKKDDIALIFEGIHKLLRNVIEANNTYLPGSQRSVDFHEEVLLLTWKLVQFNSDFREHLFVDNNGLKLLECVLFIFQTNIKERSAFPLVQICSFLLLLLSQYREFAVMLNQKYESKIPFQIAQFYGNYNDLVIIILSHAILQEREFLSTTTNFLLTAICNISPFMKRVCLTSSFRLTSMFDTFSRPRYIFTGERNHEHCATLLRIFTNLINYQESGATCVIYSILRTKKNFVNLSRKPNLENIKVLIEKVNKKSEKKIDFVPTSEWLASWKPKLLLGPVMSMIQHFSPKIEAMEGASESDIMEFIQSNTLVGIVGQPQKIVVRTLMTTPQIENFLNSYLFGLFFLKGTVSFATSKVKLFNVLEEDGEDE